MKKRSIKPKLLVVGMIVAMVASTVFLSGATIGQGVGKAWTGISAVEKNQIKEENPKEKAINFLKEVYSEHRKEMSKDQFEEKVNLYVSKENTALRKLLEDRKTFRGQFCSQNNYKEKLIKNDFKIIRVLEETDSKMVLRIEGEHEFANINSVAYKQGGEKGLGATTYVGEWYVVVLEKKGNDWEIENASSSDFTTAFLYPDVDRDSEEAVIEMAYYPYKGVDQSVVSNELKLTTDANKKDEAFLLEKVKRGEPLYTFL